MGTAAIFFDSGGTLAMPVRRGWWPKPRFTELIVAAGLPAPEDEAARAALHTGAAHLRAHWVMSTLDAEVAVYVGFYEIVLHELYGDAPAELVGALAEAAVYDLDQKPYNDVIPVLDALADAGVRLGVITNAGPSIELRHRDMGLRDYFDPFVVSAVVGHEKPGQRIYELALEQAGLPAAEVLFVDDVVENVRAASELGMDAYLIDRTGQRSRADCPGTITDLTALLRLAIPR